MGKKSNTDVELYDVLLDKFQKITSKMKYNGEKKSIGQNLLKEQAKKVEAQIVSYLKNRAEHGLELTDEMIAFKGLERKLKGLHFETVIKPQLRIADSNRRAMDGDFIPPPSQEPKLKPEDIAKTKEKYSVRYKISSKQVPTHYQGDYDAKWKCAMEMRRLHCIGQFGTFKDITIYECYDWAVENCTVKGKPIEHRNKLINGYDNAKRKTKSDIIIAKFEEDYYE